MSQEVEGCVKLYHKFLVKNHDPKYKNKHFQSVRWKDKLVLRESNFQLGDKILFVLITRFGSKAGLCKVLWQCCVRVLCMTVSKVKIK